VTLRLETPFGEMTMFRHCGIALSAVTVLAAIVGCQTSVTPDGDSDPATVEEVALKAQNVASNVGGENGFGGNLMDGYGGHMPGNMGFNSQNDLAAEASNVIVRMHNASEMNATFHLSYFASHMGVNEQSLDVSVPAGQNVDVEIPCAEIVGFGPLDTPGRPGCLFANGDSVDNTLAVPGFLTQDFVCNGTYLCKLTLDTDDLDGDGDREEFVMVSDAMTLHMMNGGPGGHHHGSGPGMIGPHHSGGMRP
jgi:hypothetical protein